MVEPSKCLIGGPAVQLLPPVIQLEMDSIFLLERKSQAFIYNAKHHIHLCAAGYLQLNALFRLRFPFDWQHALYLFLQNDFSKPNTELFCSPPLSPCHWTRELEMKDNSVTPVCWGADFSLTTSPRLCL